MIQKTRNRWRLRKAMRLWLELRDLVNAEREGGVATPAEEKAFLDLKVDLVRLVPRLAGGAPGAPLGAFSGRFEGMMDLINRYVSLPCDLSLEEREEFSKRWHEHFLFLNQLEASGFRPAGVKRRPLGVPTGIRSRPREGARWLRALWRVTGLAARTAILVILIYLVITMVGLGLGSGASISFEPPTSVAGSWHNLREGAGTVLAPAFRSLAPIESLLGSMGVIMTLILGGVAVGYAALKG